MQDFFDFSKNEVLRKMVIFVNNSQDATHPENINLGKSRHILIGHVLISDANIDKSRQRSDDSQQVTASPDKTGRSHTTSRQIKTGPSNLSQVLTVTARFDKS